MRSLGGGGDGVSVPSLSGPRAVNGKFLWRADVTWPRSPAALEQASVCWDQMEAAEGEDREQPNLVLDLGCGSE